MGSAMGHYSKLNPRPLRLAETDWYQVHTFNGGVSAEKRRTRAYKQTRVDIKRIDRVYTPSRYRVIDGVLRRDPSTLPKQQRQHGTSRADKRRARQRVMGLVNEHRQNAHRSRGVVA